MNLCREARDWIPWATLGFALLLSGIYGLQLLIAGSLEDHVAHRIVQDWIQPNEGVYLLLSPLVHSYHGHIIGNLKWLVSGGVLAEQVLPWHYLLLFVYLSGVFSNFFPPFLLVGGFGVGISGAWLAVWNFLGIVAIYRVFSASRNWAIGYTLFGAFILAFFFGQALFQWAGLVPVPEGTATGAHLLGSVLGLGFGVWWTTLRDQPDRYSLST